MYHSIPGWKVIKKRRTPARHQGSRAAETYRNETYREQEREREREMEMEGARDREEEGERGREGERWRRGGGELQWFVNPGKYVPLSFSRKEFCQVDASTSLARRICAEIFNARE